MLIVRTLICHRDVSTALVCLRSLLLFHGGQLELVLHDDGTLTEEDCEVLSEALPGSRFLFRREADERMRELLKQHPFSLRMRHSYPLSLKLLDVALLSDRYLAYCDTDILFLRPFVGLFTGDSESLDALFMTDPNQAYAIRPWNIAPLGEMRLAASVNTGIIFFNSAAYDLDFIEWLWSRPWVQASFRRTLCWAEQTSWAALAARVRCRLLSTSQFEVVTPLWRPQSTSIGAHFVTSYRSRLQEFVDVKPGGQSPLIVQTVPVRRCGILQLAAHQIARKSRRSYEDLMRA